MIELAHRWPTPLRLIAFFVVGLALQVLLLTTPGYFSHDELQWAAFADTTRWQDMPWLSWTGIETFQFRPLTFNLWLLLSRALFESPHAYHTLWAALGTVNGLMLYRLLRGLGLGMGPALLGFAAFLLNPYGAYVHGWVGTLGDLLWVGFGLGVALLACAAQAGRGLRPALLAASVATLTVLALLAKEAALSIPALLALGWWLSDRHPAWRTAFWAAAVPAALYLLLRADTLLFAPRGNSHVYGVDWLAPPRRWWEYQAFLFLPTSFQTFRVNDASSLRMAAAAGAWLLLLAALWRGAGRTTALAFLVGGLCALAPVLMLPIASNQYGYGFAAVTVTTLACAFARGDRGARTTLAVLALVLAWGGVNVQRRMHGIGELQTRFSPALAELAAHTSGPLVLLPESRAWVYLRFTHEIPSYRGVPLGARVRVTDQRAEATHVIRADGRIEPLL